MTEERRFRYLPFPVIALSAVYLISFLHGVESYGHPFPLMGRLYQGRVGEAIVLFDCIASLYLVLGILKRQRLTLWLVLLYNLFDIVNAIVNLWLLPLQDFARLAGAPVSAQELRLSTFIGGVFLIFVSAYLLRNRRQFNNHSPYLF